jgi:hypothetical protein
MLSLSLPTGMSHVDIFTSFVIGRAHQKYDKKHLWQ